MKKFFEDLIRSGIAFWATVFSMMTCMGLFTTWIGLCVKFGAISTEYFEFCRRTSIYNGFLFDPQEWAIPWIVIGIVTFVVNTAMLTWTFEIEGRTKYFTELPEE